ncbi:MAG: glycogen synthase GlgA [Acidobacteria bacterium]|nr:glycogen synthase GlgA [Acidobacteriota bacterium]
MVASEAAPWARTGGLGEVLGALPAALERLGHEVRVLLPRYGSIDLTGARPAGENRTIWLGPERYDYSIECLPEHPRLYFLDCPPLYERNGIYGDSKGEYPDNHIRFAVLARAALDVARYLFRPHVLHCHDWQAALAPVYLATSFARDPTVLAVRTLLTIHNLGYQGLFPVAALAELGLDSGLFHPGGLEFYGSLNVLKGGILFTDALSTVSRRYASEILTPEYGFGLDGVLRTRGSALTGILNGIDYGLWNPETDPYIAAHYSADDLSGKAVCKRDLIAEFGLPAAALERPLIGMVTRLAAQKGVDLVLDAAGRLVAEELSLLVLGTGDALFEEGFRDLARRHPSKIGVRIGFEEPLAHRLEAGSDLFLMPSRYEPCGLNQIYSLRYGAVPVVRATGGLDDTIGEDTGFKFAEASSEALLAAVETACRRFQDRAGWAAMMRRGMQRDFSWSAPAAEYAALYERLARLNP